MAMNVTTNGVAGSCDGASMNPSKIPQLPETYARRVIAKGLKIVTGHVSFGASSAPGSAGQTFDYRIWGSRFLWMGLTPRLMIDTAARHAVAAVLPVYDPFTRKIFLAGTNDAGSAVGADGGCGKPFKIITKSTIPTATQDLVFDFCLLVVDNVGTSAGMGI